MVLSVLVAVLVAVLFLAMPAWGGPKEALPDAADASPGRLKAGWWSFATYTLGYWLRIRTRDIERSSRRVEFADP